MYSHFQNCFGLDINIKRKKKPPPQKQNSTNITQNQPSLDLFTFLVLLHADASVIAIVIFLYCSKKWLFSYAPMCPQNLKTRLITNHNGIVMRPTINPLITKIGIEHGS
jgi:hypothetical protein